MAVFEAARAQLRKEFRKARDHSEKLFEILRPSVLYARPIAERHRVIFYLGHLDAFDFIQICREGLGIASKEPLLDELFRAGIDPDSAHLPSDQPGDWPSLAQVKTYVAQARDAVDCVFDRAPEDLLHMALEHRLMHLETLAYMWHNFAPELKVTPAGYETSLSAAHRTQAHQNEWQVVPSGDAVLGKDADHGFGWDNEYAAHTVSVPAFEIQKFNVTNGEYLRFVTDGAPLPHFWVRRGESLYWRGMFAEIPLPLDWPVYVTHREAQQYTAWLGKALPSEAQFHRAAYGTPDGQERTYPWGDAEPDVSLGNFDFARWDATSVANDVAGESAFGVRQLLGNGWEWTNTIFAPFDGFKASPSYPGYSANFFDGEHYVMKGGSPRTSARLLRRSFRNWFRSDYPYVYATFRCVEN